MASKDSSENCNELSELPQEALELMESYSSLHSCLSPSVFNLVCGVGISNTVEDALTPNLILDWSKVDQMLDLIGSDSETSSTTEYYCNVLKDIAPCIESVKSVYQQLTLDNFAISLGPFLSWTQNDRVFLRAFELLQEQENSSPSAAVLGALLLTAYMERALRDVYLLWHKNAPSLIKDIIASPEVKQIFGTKTVNLVRMFMGPPQSLNLRNILWHGFISSAEMDVRYGFFLLAIVIVLGVKFSEQKIFESIKFRNFVDLSAFQDSCAVFPDIANKEVLELQELFQSSLLILPLMKEHWQYCLKKYLECRFGECVALLIPQLEHLLRVLFSSVNNCPEKVLTAEADCHYTNLSTILSEFLDDGKMNHMRPYLGDNIMELLLDLFSLPEGPRIRDKISHGEIDVFQIPKFVVIHLLSVAAVICLKVARKPIKSAYLLELSQIGDAYQTVFHPFATVKKEIPELIESLRKWKCCPVVELKDLNVDTVPNCDFLVDETVHMCASLVGETFQINHLVFRGVVMKGRAYNAQHHDQLYSTVVELFRRFYSYSEGLPDLIDTFQELKIISVYRPKIEFHLSSRLKDIVHHSLDISENIQRALKEYFDAWKSQELSSRRKLTYVRLLKSLYDIYSGLYIVVMAAVGFALLINECSKWTGKKVLLSQKFLKRILAYTQNLRTRTGSNKNMWFECSQKTQEFLCTVNDHCKRLNSTEF